MREKYYIITLSFSLAFLLSGCEKFLEEKSDKRLSIPVTLKDFQSLLNQSGIVNSNYISGGEVSSDNYYLTDADFNSLAYESDKRLYTWQPDYVSRAESTGGNEWYNTYRTIYICNAVLHGLEENDLTGTEADNIKGQALVFRAIRYLDGAQVWAPAYNSATANTDLGMVLRLDPDMNIPSVRYSVQETYNQIIADLTEAIKLLPIDQHGLTLPNQSVAHCLLAKTYLYMAEYEKALEHAKFAFEYNSTLIDFNTLNPDANFPIPVVNQSSAEILFRCNLFYADPIRMNIAKITPDLYDMYEENDLRKVVFFRKNNDDSYTFKGNHTGNQSLIGGITSSELYLMMAECYARVEQLDEASAILNQFLEKRWKVNEYNSYSFTDKSIALDVILQERRKELIMRGLRWADIKRLNRDGANITLTREVNGDHITLPPNDPRYAIAIPEDVIEISGIQQNPR